MPPRPREKQQLASISTGPLEEDEEIITEKIPENTYVPDDRSLDIVWTNVVIFIVLHFVALYGLYLSVISAKWLTIAYAVLLYHLGAFGITGGSHRLWAHRAYKAKWPLKLFLVLCQTLAYQNSVIEWSRDHRVHHKFQETDADPHNAKRGFFFSHMGWLLCRKHEQVKIKGKGIDLSDLYAEPLLRTYTQRNCMLECQSNFTFESCKCIPYYLPKSVDVPNCSGNVKKCVLKAKNNLELSPQGIGANCNCLPACVSVQYTQTRSYGILSDNAKLNLEDIQSSSTISAKHFVKNMAVMQIYFFNSKFTTELKSELYGFTEILSNIGGLLSLCLGFSFLSLVELIYFLTLRLACYAATLHRNRRKLILEHLFVR